MYIWTRKRGSKLIADCVGCFEHLVLLFYNNTIENLAKSLNTNTISFLNRIKCISALIVEKKMPLICLDIVGKCIYL